MVPSVHFIRIFEPITRVNGSIDGSKSRISSASLKK